jgi:dGTP triphosphohydrolase
MPASQHRWYLGSPTRIPVGEFLDGGAPQGNVPRSDFGAYQPEERRMSDGEVVTDEKTLFRKKNTDLWDRVRELSAQVESLKKDLQYNRNTVQDSCRALLIQLSQPATPNEWYAALNAYNLLKVLNLNDDVDDRYMSDIRKRWGKIRCQHT